MNYGLVRGAPDIGTVGPIAFGPGDVLFVADNVNAKLVALDVADEFGDRPATPLNVDDLDSKLAGFLGCAIDDVLVKDLAVHPRAHTVYLSIMRGRGDGAVPAILRLDHDARLSNLALDDIAFAESPISNAPAYDDERRDLLFAEPPEGEVFERGGRKFRISRPSFRTSTVTDLCWIEGAVLVAGLSNEEFSSTLRRIPFPFTEASSNTSVEIFHVSHGQWETAAPIRSLLPIDGGASLLASYTCTPLVHFPLSDLVAGAQVRGRTVAELGAGNQPLDMIAFEQDGEEFVLVCHSTHPVMKIRTNAIDAQAALTEPQEPVGVDREVLELPRTRMLANLGDRNVLALQRDKNHRRQLRSLDTAAL